MKNYSITLSRCDGVYLAGSKLEGSVLLQLNKPKRIRCMTLTISGIAKSKWHVYKNDSDKSYKGYESYIDETRTLMTGGELAAGNYSYPFCITLPTEIPSSFEGQKGYIRYWCKAEMIRFCDDEEEVADRIFTVIHPLDLNKIPHVREPGVVQKEHVFESCCCEEGLIFLQLKIEKTGFVPDEKLDFTIECHNNTTSELGYLTLELLRNETYTGVCDSFFSSQQPKYHTKTTPIELFVSSEGVVRRKFTSIKNSVRLPAMPPSKLEGCNIITTEYELSLSVGAGFDMVRCVMFITIGTIPLREHITYGPIITRETAVSGQSSIVSPSHVQPTIRPVDAPPSYDQCVSRTVNPSAGGVASPVTSQPIPSTN